jgi:hypothetical protein
VKTIFVQDYILKNNKVIMTKEFLINEYMKNIDVNDISVSQIKQDLKAILHEEPFVELSYETEYVLNEINKETEKKENLTKIKIFYTNINAQGGPDEGGYVEFLL